MSRYTWQRAERSLIAVGQPIVGVAGVLATGVLVTTARTVLQAAVGNDPSRLSVPVAAFDDWRWRGAAAGVLAVESGIAVLGRVGWLDADASEALDRLLHERAAVDVAALPNGIEIMLSVPMPNGGWLRLPAVALGDWGLLIRATPLPGCEVVLALLDGVPAFTESVRLAGFVRVLRSPRSGQRILLIVRADAALTAWRRASRAFAGAP